MTSASRLIDRRSGRSAGRPDPSCCARTHDIIVEHGPSAPESALSDKDRQTAKTAVARRFERVPSGKLRVTLTLFLYRELVERLSARAVAQERKVEDLVREIVEAAGG